MAFIGREHELQALERMYQRSSFEMMVVYGRRRIGKTTLLNEFSRNRNSLFYTGIESKDEENLRGLGNTVFSFFNPALPASAAGISFSSYSDILAYITASARATPQKRLLIILDEYPYIAESAPELASLLQREIDQQWSHLNIMLVLCGSSITFMEDQVLGEKSPLYGRRTGQLDLLPMDYLTAAQFVPGYSPAEQAIVYGIAGGIPKYLAEIDSSIPLEENIIRNFFTSSGYFYEEPKNLLRQEFRDVSLYFSILSAIGSGCTQVNEISSRTGFDSSKTSQALRRLEAVRIIHRDVPILNEKNKKLTQYVLEDNMFRFWFRFVPRGTGMIERNYGEQYYSAMVKPLLHDYMGPVFEKICREYTLWNGMQGKYGDILTRVGKWRGNDPVKRTPADIDVVGINEMTRTAVIGECKFRNEHFDKKEYETFLDRARLIAPYQVQHFLIFSLGGFSTWVNEQCGKDPRVEEITLDQIYRRA